MARCRCAAGTCECHLLAGENITIIGQGDVTDPWIISSGPSAREAVRFVDGTEVEFNVVGSGVPADPYSITASLPWIDPSTGTPGDVLTKDPSGSWVPGAPANSATDAIQFVDGTEVAFDVTGNGLPSDPYMIAASLPWVDPSLGTLGEVLAKQADGSWAPAPPATATPGLITTGAFLIGDGSIGNPIRTAITVGHGITGEGTIANPLRLCMTTYDDLKNAAAC